MLHEWSWRMKLVGLVVLVLILSFLFQVFFVVPRVRNEALHTAQAYQEELAQSIARGLETDLNQTMERLTELAMRPEFSNWDLEAVGRTISTLAQGSYRFESLYLIDADGWFVSGTSDDMSVYTTKSYVDQSWFAVPFVEGETYVASPRFYPSIGLIAVTVAVPVESADGERIGVLLGGFRLNHLIEALRDYSLEGERIVRVQDRAGTVIAHSGIDLFALEDGPLSLEVPDTPLEGCIAARGYAMAHVHQHGDTVYFGVCYALESADWVVIVETPLSEIMAGSRRLAQWLLIANAALFLAALVAILVFARQIMAQQCKASSALALSEQRLHNTLEQQALANQLALSLGIPFDLPDVYHTVYEYIHKLVDTDAFILSFFDSDAALIHTDYAVTDGVQRNASQFPKIHLEEEGHDMQSQVIRTGKPVYCHDLNNMMQETKDNLRSVPAEEDGESEIDPRKRIKEKISIKSSLCVPMRFEGKVIGVIQVQSKKLDAYTQENVDLLAALANVVAIAIENARLFARIGEDSRGIQAALNGTIKSVSMITEIRDPYTAGHQRRVTELAQAIALEMELPKDQVAGIRVAGLMHDIGKMSIPAEILSKPSRLSDSEFNLIKAHPSIAHDILKTIDFPWSIAEIVLQHHERMDGSGYPQGLKREEILIEARILAVADVIEAMASHRPYRPELGFGAALEEIEKNKGTLYDPDVVDACLQLFAQERFEFGI